MAYTDEQKRQHILELQAYLHGISHQSQLPHLIPDGVYGENTANAAHRRDRHRHLERHCTGISTGSASNRTASPAVPHRHHCLCPGRQGQRRLCDTGRSTGDPQCVSCRSAGTEQRRLRHCHKKCGAAVPGADAFAAQRHSRRRHLEPPACGTAPIKKDSFSCLTL